MRQEKSNAQGICLSAANLVAGSRAKAHGDALINHKHIASLWNAYLNERITPGRKITARDAALMMALLKIARTKSGGLNLDDYIDLAGYAGCAGEIALLSDDGA